MKKQELLIFIVVHLGICTARLALPDWKCDITTRDTIQHWPFKKDYKVDDVVESVCMEGYRLKGFKLSQCYSYGWDPPLPTCEEDNSESASNGMRDGIQHNSFCPHPPKIRNSEKITIKENYVNGDTVEIKCFPNFKLQGTNIIHCENGIWASPPKCILERDVCRYPPTVAHAITVRKPSFFSRHYMAEYNCHSNYVLQGNPTVRCENGAWEDPPVCIDKLLPCGLPPSINYGDIIQTLKTKYDSGSVLVYKCPSFYILEGNQKITCWNGVWSDPPVCLEPCTATEKDMRENNIQLQWTSAQKIYSLHNDIIEFKCIPQYMISDPKLLRVTCNRGVLNYPKCFKPGTDQNKEPEKPDLDDEKLDLLLQDWIPRIVKETCDAPPEVPNGKLKTKQQASYDSGFSVEFECNADFVISGTMLNVRRDNGLIPLNVLRDAEFL
ncbi:coagulation factor XIII B chain-like isoform X2 [Pelobates fuscus]|uniref:coagulation factor XIII B chain-like isoform X2 n=1 Tax=Pelobates fuscus TaxID=191477 RepID=UPI002FE42F64